MNSHHPLREEYTPVNTAKASKIAEPRPQPTLAQYVTVSGAKENMDQVSKNLETQTTSQHQLSINLP